MSWLRTQGSAALVGLAGWAGLAAGQTPQMPVVPPNGPPPVIIEVQAPDTPAGADYAADSRSTSLTLADLPTGTSEERATVRAFRRAGFRRIYQRGFNGALKFRTDPVKQLAASAAGADPVAAS